MTNHEQPQSEANIETDLSYSLLNKVTAGVLAGALAFGAARVGENALEKLTADWQPSVAQIYDNLVGPAHEQIIQQS